MADSNEFGLKPDVVNDIRSLLARFTSVTEATLYGSRAKGNYQPGSDIDLTLKTKGETPKNLLLNIELEIDNLDLPYSFDISLLRQISNENLLKHIERVGVVLHSAEQTKTTK